MPDQCTVDVWSIALNASAEKRLQAGTLLSEEEHKRVYRLRMPEHQHRSIIALAQRRVILSQYLNQAPESITYAIGPYGKPYIEGYPLHFNLSHSHDIALLAISQQAELGIDIEYWRSVIHIDGLVKKIFTPEEQAQFYALPDDQRTASFYQVWTSKEAFVKAIGKGLYYPLSQINVAVDPNMPSRLLMAGVGKEAIDTEKFTVNKLTVPPNYTANCAVITPTHTQHHCEATQKPIIIVRQRYS